MSVSPLIRFAVRLPDGEELPLLLQTSPGMQCKALKQLLEVGMCKYGLPPLLAERVRLLHRLKELRDEAFVSDCGFSLTEPEPIQVVVKVAGMSVMDEPQLFEYREFVRCVDPPNGATKVPLKTSIHIQFGCNHAGYCISLSNLRDASSWSSPDPRFGDMVRQLDGDIHLAKEKGFVQWTQEKHPQRVLLLQLDAESAAKMFPPPRRPPKAASPAKPVRGATTEKVSATTTMVTASAGAAVAPCGGIISTTFLDTKRYWHRGVNEGYSGGDFHSWQRYTSRPPVDTTISEHRWPVPHLNDTAYAVEPVPYTRWRRDPDLDPDPDQDQDKDQDPDPGQDQDQDQEELTAPQLLRLLESAVSLNHASTIADEYTHVSTLTLRPMEPLQPATTYAVLLMNSVPTMPVGDCLASWAAFSGVGIVAEDCLFSFTTTAD